MIRLDVGNESTDIIRVFLDHTQTKVLKNGETVVLDVRGHPGDALRLEVSADAIDINTLKPLSDQEALLDTKDSPLTRKARLDKTIRTLRILFVNERDCDTMVVFEPQGDFDTLSPRECRWITMLYDGDPFIEIVVKNNNFEMYAGLVAKVTWFEIQQA